MSEPAPSAREKRKAEVGQLRLLALLHFVAAGVALAVIGVLFWHYSRMHAAFLDVTAWKRQQDGGVSLEQFFGEFRRYYLISGAVVAACGTGNLLSGLFICRRVCRLFSLFVAGLNCVVVPVGTILGAFTLVVLFRDSVREAYDAKGAAPAQPGPGRGPQRKDNRP